AQAAANPAVVADLVAHLAAAALVAHLAVAVRNSGSSVATQPKDKGLGKVLFRVDFRVAIPSTGSRLPSKILE
ncbi:MAG: hypothetical protein OSB29_09770, partial [Verrucomicrobiota bacterium]|nr:hypothetical protein [Verrucomicrobiota bacterium]